MEKELQNHVYTNLHKGRPCTVNQFIEKFSCFKPTEFIEMFISIYQRDRNQNFDLLCHIVVSNDLQMRIQMQRYSNIQKGVLVENSNHFTTHQFKRQHVRQLKILAIFPKQLLISNILPLLEKQPLPKTQEFINKFVLVPKLVVQNTGLVKNKVKKDDKKQQKPLEAAKSQQPVVQQKKVIKKTQSKSSMQIEQKQVAPIAPLKKVSVKEQPTKAPVLTSYAEQRSRVEQEIQVKPPQNKKLNLDSDEQYYNANPNLFSQQMKSKTQQETDHSAVKADLDGQKMEIECENMKGKAENIIKFIVDDDDDDDEEFMRQIAAKKRLQADQERQSSTQPKKQSQVAPLALKPKVEPPKVVAPPVKSKASVPVTSKAPASLKGWLVPKKI